MKKPIPNDGIQDYIKKVIGETGKCPFQNDDIGVRYCHFVYDPVVCGSFGNLIGFDKDMRREFYKCKL